VLVIDASMVVHMALHGRPPALDAESLVAPPLLWSEATSVLHELSFRGDIEPDISTAAIEAISELGIERVHHPQLYMEAARVARKLGWAKTYDAEYVALAMLTASSLLTRDARLHRGASRLVSTVVPTDL
jgi:predicted nucleic acid-binding protein